MIIKRMGFIVEFGAILERRETLSGIIENPYNFIKKRLQPTQMFSCKFCEILKTIVFTGHLPATTLKK